MRLLNRSSISKKLTLFGVATSVIVVLLMGIALALCDLRNIHVALTQSYGTMVDVIGQSCVPALEEGDREAASRLLKVLDEDSEILAAELLDAQGNLFVEYMASQEADSSGQIRTVGLPHAALTFERPIAHQNIPIGRLRLVVSSTRLWSTCWEHIQLILLVTLASVLFSIISAGYLQRMISGPVVHLVETARTVSRTGDYSLRARPETADEFGELSAALNEMLGQIESRDAELDLHRRHLEALVRLRTEALEQMTREALAASVAKSQFLANMSHEIRTPMNAILGFADLLKRGADGGDDSVRDEFLETIATSGRHLLTLINDVLDLSKIESGKVHVETLECSPHRVITEAASVLRAKAIEKGLSLEFNWDGPVPAKIHSDDSRLRQLLINLIGNAVKFTTQGGVRITACVDVAAQQLKISVFDTGIGIANEKLEEIFEPFAQADASVTRRFGGTGLGLAISRRVAEALGGSLTVESEIGRGSTFVAVISTGLIAADTLLEVPPSAEMERPGAAQAALAQPLAPARILLVEDGETNRKLIRVMLERHGLEVVEAADGRVGLERALAEDFDLILMDMQMPVMDGYTAVHELRTRGVILPIVALTAHAMAGDAEKCLAAGCSDYLSKPINEPQLLALLGGHLRGSIDAIAESQQQAARTTASAEEGVHTTLPTDDHEFCEIVAEFIDRARQQTARLRTAVESQQWSDVAEIAHWLKGSGGTAGFEAFTAPAGRIERLARGGLGDEIPIVLAQIESLVSRLVNPVLSVHS